MERGRRQNKRRRRTKVEDDGDKISTLPNSILHEIFSFVDIKQIVQTSVLSRRWRYVWTTHPYLNIEFPRKIPAAEGDDAQLRKYTNLITQFMSLRDQSCGIIRSRFSIFSDLNREFLDEYVSYLVNHNVEKLHIHTIGCTDPPYKFPSCFYSCDSLTELDLECNRSRRVDLLDTSLEFPNLKKLRLKGFTFWCDDDDLNDSEDDDEFPFEFELLGFFFVPRSECIRNEFFSKCVKLECLILEKCDFKRLNVSLPLLNTLEIKLYTTIKPDDFDVVIELDTPLLNSFKLEGGASVVLLTKSNLSCLEKLHVDLYQDSFQLCEDSVQKRVLANLIEMFEKLENASTVVLAPETVEILAYNPIFHASYPPLFYGLKYLEILEPRKDEALPLQEVTNVCFSFKKAPLK